MESSTANQLRRADTPIPDTDDLLAVRQVAERLQLSTRTVYRLIEGGDLPSVGLTRNSKRIWESALRQFSRIRTTRSASPIGCKRNKE